MQTDSQEKRPSLKSQQRYQEILCLLYMTPAHTLGVDVTDKACVITAMEDSRVKTSFARTLDEGSEFLRTKVIPPASVFVPEYRQVLFQFRSPGPSKTSLQIHVLVDFVNRSVISIARIPV